MTPTTSPEIVLGCDEWHGEHENPRQGWDTLTRQAIAAQGRLDPDADTYGRHANTPPAQENQ